MTRFGAIPRNVSLVTGLVHAVMQVKSSNPTRWIITVGAKQGMAA